MRRPSVGVLHTVVVKDSMNAPRDVGAGSHACPWEDGVWCICRGDACVARGVGAMHVVVVTDRMNALRHVGAGSHACPWDDGVWRICRGDACVARWVVCRSGRCWPSRRCVAARRRAGHARPLCSDMPPPLGGHGSPPLRADSRLPCRSSQPCFLHLLTGEACLALTDNVEGHTLGAVSTCDRR